MVFTNKRNSGGLGEIPRNKDVNPKQITPQVTEFENRTQATMVGTKSSLHCIIPAPSQLYLYMDSVI